MSPNDETLTVAVTGVTGTVGSGLLPFLEADPRIGKVIGVARRPWSPEREGLRKVEYRQADLRDEAAVRGALRGADVVVHLAFSLYGVRQSERTLEEINVEGSARVAQAALDNGARRLLYVSSGAVYGFDERRPVRVDEDAPVAPARRHFYSVHKARVEGVLQRLLADREGVSWTFFRPCAIVGRHAAGAAAHFLPARVRRAAGAAFTVAGAAGLRPPVPAPPVPLQFVHERDVGQAIHRAIDSEDSGRIYNVGGEGMVQPEDVPRLVGLRTLPLPLGFRQAIAKHAARLPKVSPALSWPELVTHPLELDTSRIRRDLGWEPEFTSAEALATARRSLGL